MELNLEYSSFLERFLNHGYRFIEFENYDEGKKNQIILRHDIDHSLEYAYRIAKIENSLDIRSVFFIMLSSNSYNPFTSENMKLIERIIKLNHKVGLHFDPTIYKDLTKSLEREIYILKNIFNSNTNIISLHRPLADHLKPNFINYITTYDDKYFRRMKYFSDSNGEFKYGNPLQSKDFKLSNNIQLLIHPIWWIDRNLNRDLLIKKLKRDMLKGIEKYLTNNIRFYNGE